MSSGVQSQSALLLTRQLAGKAIELFLVPHCHSTVITTSELRKHPVEGFSAGLVDDDDIYRWEILIIGPRDTL